MRDALLVARFELLRALRTWRALALLVMVVVSAAGAAWLFAEFVGMLENTVADQLAVQRTEVPGAMLDTLVASDTWRDMVSELVSPHLVDYVLRVPPLAMFDLWFSFVVVPFFATSAAAECLAIDVRSRAIRFEASRTGRLELAFGRFLGQATLTAVATFAAAIVVWLTGLATMVVDEPVTLLAWLVAFVPRSVAFGLPFVGLGVAASQVTSSPAWARVLAVGLTSVSWVVYVTALNSEGTWWAPLGDATLQILPQGWLRGLWEPGAGWAGSGLALGALTLAALSVGYVRFAGRDL